MAVSSVILQGDYVGTHNRQQMAATRGCICVVDLHFNSFSDPSASGGGVIHQISNSSSKPFADAMWAELAASGLPPHGSPVQSTEQVTRGAYIDSYIMPTILLEPLFVSNGGQASWLHDADNFRHLAEAVSAA